MTLYGKLKRLYTKKNKKAEESGTEGDTPLLSNVGCDDAGQDTSNGEDYDESASHTSDDFDQDLAHNIGLDNVHEVPEEDDFLPTLPPELFQNAIFSSGGRKSICIDEADTKQHRLQLAADYVNDALHGRTLQLQETTKSQRFFQQVYKLSKTLVVIVVLLHMSLSLWEDPSNSCVDETWVQVCELCALTFYTLDIGVGLMAFRPSRYLNMRWNFAYILTSTSMLIEYVVSCTNYTRPFLSIMLICRVSSLRNTANSIFRSIPKAAEVFVLFFVILTFYSLLGVVFFRNSYQDLDTEFTGSFDSFGRAAIAMFVLSTTENYPFVMYPAMDDYPYMAVLFFVSYLMIVFYLVLALFQAALYSEWRQELEHQLLKNRVETYNALLAAFHVLMDDGSSSMPEQTWIELVQVLKPSATVEDAKYMFAVMDTNNDQKISLMEFLANATVAVELNFGQLKRDIRKSRKRVKQRRSKIINFGHFARPYIKRAMRSDWFEPVCILNILCHTITLCLSEFPMSSGSRAFINVFLFFSFFEMMLKLVAYPDVFNIWRAGAKIDLAIVVASVCVEWVGRALFSFDKMDHACAVMQCLRIFRLINLNKKMRQLIATVMTVKTVIIRFFLCYGLIIYAFASAALIIFDNNIPESDDYDINDDDDLDVLDPKVQINTIQEATLALFQIAVTNNWQDIMYENCIKGEKVGLWSAIFFIVYFICVVWLGTNIMTAVILDAYVTIVDKREKRLQSRENREKSVFRGSANRGKNEDTHKGSMNGLIFRGNPNGSIIGLGEQNGSTTSVTINRIENSTNNGRDSPSTTEEKKGIGTDEVPDEVSLSSDRRDPSFCVDLYSSMNDLDIILDQSNIRSSQNDGDEVEAIKARLKKADSITAVKNKPEFKDFDAAQDLQTPEVIDLLQKEVTKTHQRIRRDSVQLQESFRKKTQQSFSKKI